MKYLATLRVTYDADDDLEARMISNEIQETLDKYVLEDDDTADITQLLPYGLPNDVSPTEIVDYMRRTVDLLISTRIVQCVDLASQLHKTAWILERRGERGFDLTGYDYGEFQARIDEVLNRNPT